MAAGFPEGDLLVGFKTGHPVCDMDGEGCPEYEPKRECTMPCLGKHREYARLEGKRVDLEEKAGHDGGEAGAEWLDTVGRQAMLLTLPKGEEPC